MTTVEDPPQVAVAEGIGGWVQRRRRGGRGWLPYALVAPIMLYVVLIFLAPLVFTVGLTFVRWNIAGGATFVGLENYHLSLSDPIFWTVLKNTLVLAAIVVPGTVVAGLLVALALQSRSSARLKGLWRLLVFLPYVTSLVAVGYVWQWIYHPAYGIVNHVLSLVGLPAQPFLHSQSQALLSVAIIIIWQQLGFVALIFIAGLDNVPQELLDAGQLDGAGRLARFYYVQLPELQPQFLLVGVLQMIFALRTFEIPLAASGGGPGDASRTAVMYVYQRGFEFFDFGRGSVLALVLFVIILGVTQLQQIIARRVSDE